MCIWLKLNFMYFESLVNVNVKYLKGEIFSKDKKYNIRCTIQILFLKKTIKIVFTISCFFFYLIFDILFVYISFDIVNIENSFAGI